MEERVEMVFMVWDSDRDYIHAEVVESLEDAETLAKHWINDPRAHKVGMHWRKKKRAGFSR